MAAELTPVLITRRDGSDFVLMSESEAEANRKLLDLTSQLLSVALDDRGTLVERMINRFPWMLALREDGQEQCAQDLMKAAMTSLATNRPNVVLIEFNAWFDTAELLAAGFNIKEIEKRPRLKNPIPVARP
ncbi:MAG: hypothetical protein RL174_1047 [Actinomycetota bacterium]